MQKPSTVGFAVACLLILLNAGRERSLRRRPVTGTLLGTVQGLIWSRGSGGGCDAYE